MKFLRRYLFSFIFLVLTLISLVGWWDSSRNWTTFHLETPVGIFLLQNESSLFILSAQFMRHENRWSKYRAVDPIWNDRMKLVLRLPLLRYAGGRLGFLIPHWQLVLSLLVLSFMFLGLARRKIAKTLAAHAE